MGTIDNRWRHGPTRRQALLALAGMLAGSPLLRAQRDPHPITGHKRVPGLDEMMTAFDFEPICFANVVLARYEYMARASESEFTLRRNREAFEWVDLVERPGAATAALQTSTEVLGIKMDCPIMIAPTAAQRDLHPDAESAMYQGASAAKTPMIVVGRSTIPIEKIAQAATGPRWSQFYPVQDLKISRETIETFQAAGARALVVTVDQQTDTGYERDLHNRNLGGTPRGASGGRGGGAPEQGRGGRGGGSAAPAPMQGPALYRVIPARLWYTWKYLDDIRAFTKIPILLKGILTAEDAKLCVERGFDGVIVSNHGGRSMDYGPSTLEVLPEIVDAVGGKIPVLIDGGFRRGSDIVKAMALGASAVCLGRAPRWGLGAFGPQGVQRLLEILQAEFLEAMARTGRTTLAALDRRAVRVNFT
ncbi:MAG: alpha-hydroxy-acid oxidizing protein [Acidobacteria bacterium]|nr:alpha-hydroxy-acid oxidizing protein [Acidobacteriota bacterium]